MPYMHLLTIITAIEPSTEAVVDTGSLSQSLSDMISLADGINLGLLVLTFLGLLFTGFQLMQTKKINRASLVKEMYFNLYNDQELRDIFYKIEWSEYKSTDRFNLEGDEEERKVDKLLSFFDIICNMYYRGVLTKKDMEVFSYEMMRVYEHPAVQEYLEFLEDWQKSQNIGESYVNLKKYCNAHFK